MQQEGSKSGWYLALAIAIVIAVILFGTFVFGGFSKVLGNVAVIKVSGELVTEGDGSLMTKGISSTDIISFIEEAEESPTIKAVMFEINSPGGSAVASQEVVQKIKSMKKPKIALIRESGASGAYWIASATDHIIANPMSITGSVGVTASYLEFADFIKRYNVTYQKLVAGKHKDMGSPFAKQTTEERDIFQQAVDLIQQMFLEDVKSSRKLTQEQADNISTGVFFLGVQAKELGLVDQLGTKEDAKEYLEEKLGAKVDFTEYEKPKSFLQSLFSAEFAYNIGLGIGSVMKDAGLSDSFEIRT